MTALSVTTTPQKVPACIEIQSLETNTAPVYFDNFDRVSSSSGVRLNPGGTFTRDRRANDLWVVAGSGTQDLRYIV